MLVTPERLRELRDESIACVHSTHDASGIIIESWDGWSAWNAQLHSIRRNSRSLDDKALQRSLARANEEERKALEAFEGAIRARLDFLLIRSTQLEKHLDPLLDTIEVAKAVAGDPLEVPEHSCTTWHGLALEIMKKLCSLRDRPMPAPRNNEQFPGAIKRNLEGIRRDTTDDISHRFDRNFYWYLPVERIELGIRRESALATAYAISAAKAPRPNGSAELLVSPSSSNDYPLGRHYTAAATPNEAAPLAIVSIERDKSRVCVDGEWYDVTDAQIRIIEKLTAEVGAWVGGPDLKIDARTSERPDQHIKRMPTGVRKHIESHRAKGYRWTE